MALAIAAILFVLLTGGITLLGWRRFGRAANPIGTAAPSPANSAGGMQALTQFAGRVGEKLPPPAESASQFAADLRAAGYRSANAPAVFYGIKLTFAAVFLLVGLLFQTRMHFGVTAQAAYVLVAALGGFRLPGFFLARKVKERLGRIRRGLPDAFDLMIVCAEAGTAMDRALRIVARELEFAHPDLADELNLSLLEVNAGSTRRDALLRMAERTREAEVKKFVTVLVQADRFGTDIAEALRVHSEHLRVRRRQDSEERAGKVSVKLVFPIFLFILPCMLLVTVGPAAIQIWQTVLPALSGK
jgi:tight adherence protein C